MKIFRTQISIFKLEIRFPNSNYKFQIEIKIVEIEIDFQIQIEISKLKYPFSDAIKNFKFK
jgi:hypothetical protein